jgi:uncharacterized protein (TIGR02217 family)
MFLDELFPREVSMGAFGGPAFDVDIVTSNSGVEWRNQISETPRWEFEVSHAARMPEQWKPLQAFWLVVAGMSNTFRYWDHLDFRVEAGEAGFIQLTGVSPANQWQMCKVYTFGSQTFYRRITKPIQGTVSGIANIIGSPDYDTGIIQTSGTPSGGTWEFHVHARFNTRQMRAETIDRNNARGFIVGWSSIPIVEVKAAE